MAVRLFPPGSDVEAESLPTPQLIENLAHFSHHYRGRAVTALGKRLPERPDVFDHIMATITNPINRNARVLGVTTVSWLGAIAILENGTPEQIEQVSAVLRGWDETEKEDLRYYLRNGGLDLHF